MEVMPIETIPDWERRLRRQDAFWEREIIDRPVTIIKLWTPCADEAWPADRAWANQRERWMDADFMAEAAVHNAMNMTCLGDALPMTFPNLGPEIFSAFLGSHLEYGDSTSWSVPLLEDWAQVDRIGFSEDNPYWIKINAMTDRLLEAGRGKFYTGITDLHPGADAIAAFRDPANLNIDMLEHFDEVKALLERVNGWFFQIFDHFYDKLVAAGQACTTWPGIVSTKRWHVPSNDFSCMISKPMFDDVFLPGLIAECEHMEANIYHLDGPNALRHLDSLLAIPSLNAIQWVYGAGQGRASDWLPVYKRCQQAGKGLQLGISADELPLLMRELRPEGVWLSVEGLSTPDEADAVLREVARWT